MGFGVNIYVVGDLEEWWKGMNGKRILSGRVCVIVYLKLLYRCFKVNEVSNFKVESMY